MKKSRCVHNESVVFLTWNDDFSKFYNLCVYKSWTHLLLQITPHKVPIHSYKSDFPELLSYVCSQSYTIAIAVYVSNVH